MEGKHSKQASGGWLEGIKRGLANYPLTFYFGVLFLALAAIFVLLSVTYGFNFTFGDFYNWLNAHAALLLILATFGLGLVLVTSAMAYKTVSKMSKQDYAIWLQMRSTKTLFPFFTPLHDWLRMRSRAYRWWHTTTYASPIHTIILIGVILFAFHSVSSQVVVAGQLTGGGVQAGSLAGSVNAGSATSITITAYTGGSCVPSGASCSNVDTAYRGTIHFTSSDSQAVLPGDYTFISGDNGVHTFTNAITLKTSGLQSITVTDNSTSKSGSASTTVAPLSATQISFSGLPSTSVATTNLSPVVTAKDTYGNIATGYTGTVHFTSTDGAATLPTNYTFVGGDAGVHTFTAGVTLNTVGSKSVTVTDVGNGSLTATKSITVISSTNASSVSTTFNTCADVAGNNTAWTNASNATATDTNLATNSLAASVQVSGSYYFNSGTYQAAWSTTNSTTKFNDGSVGDTTTFESKNAVGQTNVYITGFFDAGSSVSPTSMTAELYTDSPIGNNAWLLEGSADHVSWTSVASGGSFTNQAFAAVSANSGLGTYRYYRLSVNSGDNDGEPTYTMKVRISDWRLNVASVPDYIKCTQLVSSVPTNATITGVTINVLRKASSASAITDSKLYLVKGGTIQTGWTNKASGTSWPTTLTTATYGGSADLWGGTLTASDVNASGFGVALQPGSTTAVTASIDSITVSVNYTTPAAMSLTITTSPTSTTAGTAISATVTAKDSSGSTMTNYAGTVHFTSNDTQAILPNDYTFVGGDSGVHTFTSAVTLKTAGTETVTVNDTTTDSITGSANVTVSAASATTLTVAASANTVVAGSTLSATVTAKDSYGNTATGYTGTVHFTSTDGAATLPSNYTFVGGDSGVHTFTNGVTLKTADTETFTATDTITNTITGTTSTIIVTPASTSVLAFSSTPTTATAGTAFSTTVTAVDAYGNTQYAYTGTVHFTSTDSQAVLPGDYTFTSLNAGTHTFSSAVTLKTTGSQTITATDTVTGSITATSAAITVSPAAVSKLVTTSSPTSVTAGSAFSETIAAEDVYNNVVPSYTGTVHFTSSDVQAILPGDYTFVGGDAGTHTFTTAFTLKTAGSKTVVATDAGNGSLTTTATITVNAGSVTQLVFSSTPSTATAGTAISATVNAEDTYGNVVSSYVGAVHFTSTDSQAVLPGDYTFISGDHGTHTFSSAVTFKTTGSQTLTVTDKSNGSITGSVSVVVSAAATTQLVISTVASSVAGTAFDAIVSAKDAYNNTVTSYTGTVAFSSNDTQAVLPVNYTFVPGDAGSHTFTNGVTLKTAGSDTLTVAETTPGVLTTTATITVTHAHLSSMSLTTSVGTVTAGTALTPTVSVYDAYNNLVTDYTATVSFSSDDAQATLPNNYTFVSGDGGTHAFTNGVTLKTAGYKQLTVSDNAVGGDHLTAQTHVTVNPASAVVYTISSVPSSPVAGSTFSPVLTAKDTYNNTATGYTGTVHFTSSDGAATLPTNYTFISGDAGSHTFTGQFSLKTTGSQSITATDTITNTITVTANATVVAGDASGLTISSVPSSVTAGSAFSATVTVHDSNGNVATGYTGTVHFSSSDGQAVLPTNYTFISGDAGSHTFSSALTLKTAGSKTVTVTDINSGSLTDTATFTVNPAGASTLTLSATPTTVTAGDVFSTTVIAKDAYNNVATGYTGTVHFTSSDGAATLPTNYTFISGDAGSHTFNTLVLHTVGSMSITVAHVGGGGPTSATANITVTPGTVSSIAFSSVPPSATAGSAFSVTVTAKDGSGNTVTSYTGTVHFTSSDTQAVLPGNYTFVGGDNGTHTFSSAVTLKTAGSRSITVTDTNNSALTDSTTVVVSAAAASRYQATGPVNTSVNIAISATLTVKDAYNNTVTNYTGTVDFTSSDGNAVLPSSYMFVSGDAGSHSFTNAITMRTSGNQTVTMTDHSNNTLTATLTIDVSSGVASSLVFTTTPLSTPAGTAFGTVLTVKDVNGNTVTSYTGTIHFSSSDSAGTLPGDYTFVSGDAGSHSFASGFTFTSVGNKTVTATDTQNGSLTNSFTILVVPGAARQLVFGSVPAITVANTVFSPSITVEDAYNNVVTTFADTIHFSSSDLSAVLPSNYTFNLSDSGFHIFTGGFALKTAGNQTITATGANNSDNQATGSASLSVVSGDASQLVISQTPSSVTAGQPFSATVTLHNSDGSIATSYTGTVHFSSNDSQAALPADYTFKGTDAGTHTFSNAFTFKTAGTETLTATDKANSNLNNTAQVVVNPAPFGQLVATAPLSTIIGTSFSVTITAEDSFGNPIPNYASVIGFNSTDTHAQLPGLYGFKASDKGVHTFTNAFALNTLGFQNITVAERITNGTSALATSFGLNVTSKTLPPPPTVTITTPADGSTVNGSITVAASASAIGGIKNVTLLADSTVLTVDTTLPYQTTLDTTKLTNGNHLITAIALANNGLSAIAHVTINVANGASVITTGPTNPTNPTNPIISKPVQKAASATSVVSAAVAFASFAPTASAVTTAISTTAVQGVSLFNLPFLGVGRRRRRKHWGLVKNSLTGLPISGVFVELWNVTRPELLAKTLTDSSGQFAFLVDKPGQFRLRVDNPLYKTYDSGIITITDPKADLVRREIVLQPIEKIMQARLQKALRLIRLTEYLYILHWPLLIVGSALSALVLYEQFSIGRLIMVIIYGILWLSKLFQVKYQRPYGVVVDSATERPQELSIVQLTTKDADSTQVVRSTITDSHGRFLFVVKPDKYNLVAAKAGFKPTEKEIKGDNVNVDIRLKWNEEDDKL